MYWITLLGPTAANGTPVPEVAMSLAEMTVATGRPREVVVEAFARFIQRGLIGGGLLVVDDEAREWRFPIIKQEDGTLAVGIQESYRQPSKDERAVREPAG